LLTLKRCRFGKFGYDLKKQDAIKTSNKYVDGVESRLRELLTKYQDMLLGWTVDEELSRSSFVSQLSEHIQELDQISGVTMNTVAVKTAVPSFIKIASIDLDRKGIQSALLSQKTTEELSSFWETVFGKGQTIESLKEDDLGTKKYFIANPHVTLLHFKNAEQSAILSKFGSVLGCRVEVTVTGMLWNEEVAAFVVSVAEKSIVSPERGENGVQITLGPSHSEAALIPASSNEFVHVTVWCKPGVSPSHSNALPSLVDSGKATQVKFEQPISLVGTVSFWSMNKH
jgi:Fungal tRNA ligase phosphodiesterase domain